MSFRTLADEVFQVPLILWQVGDVEAEIELALESAPHQSETAAVR